jgi:predicted nucleic acid-binding protein
VALVDASFLIALLDPADPWHPAARKAAPAAMKLKPWRTHALALGEVVAVLGSRRGGKAARAAYESIRDTNEILMPAAGDLDAAMRHVLHHDGRLSLSDALFVHYARRHGDETILSFDADFDKAGLRRLPPLE